MRKLIPVTRREHTWERLFQKHVVNIPEEGYSSNTSWAYLRKVIPVTRREHTWGRLFQKHVVSIPEEGYSSNTSGAYLRKVIPVTRREHTWGRLFQKHVVSIPEEGYSRNTSWAYPRKVILETRREHTRGWLFQKHVVSIPEEGYSRNPSCAFNCLSMILYTSCSKTDNLSLRCRDKPEQVRVCYNCNERGYIAKNSNESTICINKKRDIWQTATNKKWTICDKIMVIILPTS